MEEILASIRRIIADDQAHSALLPGVGVDAEIDAGLGASAITFDDDVLYAASEDEEETAEPQAAAARAPAPSVSVPPAKPEAAPPAATREAPQPAAAPAREVPAEPLLSSAADASAASAFQTLSSVVLNRAPRTLDDVVQDMLRPMLKAWLDENLPPLVEKLVKAEIERISRAGR